MRRKTKSKLKIYLIVFVAISVLVGVGAYMGLIDFRSLGTLNVLDDGVDTDGDGINDFEDNCPNGVNSLTSRTGWFDGTLRGTFFALTSNEQQFVNHPTGSLSEHQADNKLAQEMNNEKLKSKDTDQRLKLGCGGMDWDNDGTPNIRFTVFQGGLWRHNVGADFCPYTEGVWGAGGNARNFYGAGGVYLYTIQSGCPDRDADKDGSANEIDQCWLTYGLKPDGCPFPDTDGDGIKDNFDICPNTPSGTSVGIQGCNDGSDLQCTITEQVSCLFGMCECETLPDVDGDGIYDIHDECVDEPETKNGYQDADGCPDVVPLELRDTDGDRINDHIDQCINEPENYNGFEDADGCPDILPPYLVDTDEDGIFNHLDQCINEKETHNGFVDDDGCPDVLPLHLRDSDADGIFDDVDQCITEVENINHYQDDDGCPDVIPLNLIDDDGDGVFDDIDQCRNTDPRVIKFVDETGCRAGSPQITVAEETEYVDGIEVTSDGEVVTAIQDNDHDGDGILNINDECPTRRGTEVFSGCPDTSTLIISNTFEISESSPQSTTAPTSSDTTQIPIISQTTNNTTTLTTQPSNNQAPTTTTDRSDVQEPQIIRGIDNTILYLFLIAIMVIIVLAVLASKGKIKA